MFTPLAFTVVLVFPTPVAMIAVVPARTITVGSTGTMVPIIRRTRGIVVPPRSIVAVIRRLVIVGIPGWCRVYDNWRQDNHHVQRHQHPAIAFVGAPYLNF